MDPHGLVAQVISLHHGVVQLSWLFDWRAAPSEFSNLSGVAKEFVVSRYRSDHASQDCQACEIRRCTKPPLRLELPVGHRYSLQVNARLLLDAAAAMGQSSNPSTQQHPGEVVWSSSLSSPVLVDLRSLPPHSGQGGSNAAPVAGAGAMPRPSVAASLGALLGGLPRGSPPTGYSQPVVSPGAISSTAERVKPSVNTGPLFSSCPSVVKEKPLAAFAEKEAVRQSTLLAMSSATASTTAHGGDGAALPGKLPVHDPPAADDAEDGTLLRLSNALKCFQRNADSQYVSDAHIEDVLGAQEAGTRILGCMNIATKARCRSVCPRLREWIATYLQSLDLEPVVCLAVPTSCGTPCKASVFNKAAGDEANGAVPVDVADPAPPRLIHISGALQEAPLSKPRGAFCSKVATASELGRDFARVMLASGRRLFLVAHNTDGPQSLALDPGLTSADEGACGHTDWVKASFRAGLEQQLLSTTASPLGEAALAALCERLVAAMSASIGVDFAAHVGLQPAFLQPLFILLVLGSGCSRGAALPVRVVCCGFVAGGPGDVQGDRPDAKFTPWCASLASPDLRSVSSEAGASWQWEYSVRGTDGSVRIQDAMHCDLLHMQAAAVSGTWPGLL